jgi:hypothetical protein
MRRGAEGSREGEEEGREEGGREEMAGDSWGETCSS